MAEPRNVHAIICKTTGSQVTKLTSFGQQKQGGFTHKNPATKEERTVSSLSVL